MSPQLIQQLRGFPLHAWMVGLADRVVILLRPQTFPVCLWLQFLVKRDGYMIFDLSKLNLMLGACSLRSYDNLTLLSRTHV